MAEDIRGLIEKIQQEGIQAAQDKAGKIEAEARRRAEEIIAEAKAESQRMLSRAKEEIRRTQDNSNRELQQAGRDLLISLKEEIRALLDKSIAISVQEALNPQELAKIIGNLIKEYVTKDNPEIIISLNKGDLDKLEKDLLSQLKDRVKKGVVLRSSEDIVGGFIISYDGGKSQFDFTDQALAEYIGNYLKPKLKEILGEVKE